MKKLNSLFTMALVLIALVPAASALEEVDLVAGQNIDAGNITVWNDMENLSVKYAAEDGWVITETHLAVAGSLDGIPTTKKGSPIPGQFALTDTHDPAVTEYTYTISLDELGIDPNDVEDDDTLFIATHAVVQKTEVITPAPYDASRVIDYNQGLQKNGNNVSVARSVPEQGLVYETGRNESNFFSLGFGGNITVEFACPIRNGEGSDLKIIEDTWGSYPVEKAEVYASPDGEVWTYLGEANNTQRDPVNYIHTIAEFDLGSLEEARYIKIVDTSDPSEHNSNADGYDLNAIQSLQDCIEVTEETAWGNGTPFLEKGNWAMYFTYDIGESTVSFPAEGNAYVGYEDRQGGDFDYNDFGMNMQVEEKYTGSALSSIYMEFEAVAHKAGDKHDIHIFRELSDSTEYIYTISRSTAAEGTETPEGVYSGAGDFDAVLFDTLHFTADDNVSIMVEITSSDDTYDENPVAPRFDLAPLFAFYDPWMNDRSIGNVERHIPDMQPATTKLPEVGYNVPYIVVVPYTDWPAPDEAVTITGPYPDFDDYYQTEDSSYENWFVPAP
ncbi:MAG: hypothetical protein AB3K77_10970 [Methanosarcinaceae archaeon]